MTATHLDAVKTVEPERIEERFHQLTQEWKQATRVSSSAAEMAMHPAYQQIIGLGAAAIPLLLRELRKEPDHWFWALRAIAGEDPVPAAARGQVPAMTEAWLDWLDRHRPA